ncbi:glycoside hydrolase family 3 C-terminal domain-containing protein [Frankia sp. CNm7]|uniref:Glycoside hydrolase family 3 C-terminal domain-containing protein n=1 Tax=Frankia nepalensis TaxID=1836974 RepID=A0A937UL89_9ACTN|nr:glycoside hydrolase family 3 N-terminal domain-containing protein [Frankia nepalensis]MBL7496351.1 glycoside hydrolase family 3 C-terminal domain-containing protein [Frankia nepalensis]MBL7508452.1 glycoside hydrolase family 3 C-terminal domain-containing protein [Frankia nepalensis]MBL7520270.1 glycoside hydrolase family 3 C-terminal domain-containing protein [Frankia nepalensis]MBL7627584.1 glycoside hydrolase family 3 C-terminal domain-containing protein [Frankia nepalensis]
MSQDATSSPEARATELLRMMTVEEKSRQVTGVPPAGLLGVDGLLPDAAQRILGLGVGHVTGLGMLGHKAPDQVAKTVNEIQRFLVTRTRLGIPAIFHVEALNGVVSPGFTTFPTAIGLAATWNPDGVEEMAAILRRQVRAIGHPFVLSPVMDVARDARWGRVHETYGEDPYLVSAMSVAFTRGMQGTDLREGAIATGKHFLGYGLTEAGQNMARTTVGPRELYEVYARPFEAAIKLAGLAAVMNSYSTVDGVPAGASREILTGLLRDRLGFTGTVVSDYDTVGHLHRRLRVARDAEEAGRLALAAGLDVELPIPDGYGPVLAQAVERGAVPLEQLDQACWRVLRDKFALGLFDQPYVPEDPVVINTTARAGADLAHDLARQSVTLLKNEGQLPLSRDLRRIAIIGPHADSIGFAFPAYTYPGALQMFVARRGEQRTIPGTEQMAAMFTDETIRLMIEELSGPLGKPADDYLREMYGAQSLAEAVRAAVPDAEVTVTAGCGVLDEEPADISVAVAAARNADVVILALGGRGGWFTSSITEGEDSDTANLDLPANQVALVRAVTATGTPCVGIVHTGRPMALAAVVDALPALLYGYYGGQHAAMAMTEVLFGDVNPGGKLPISLPRHSGQVPIYSGQPTGSGYRRTEHDMHQDYLDMPSTPLFPFGHGLSYTTFDYGDFAISPSDVDAADVDAAVTVRLTVRNSGDRAGDEVVQLYFSDQATGVTRPAQELVGFLRLGLAPGAAAAVAFTVAMSQLGYIGLDGRFVLEPGPVQVLVGGSSDDIRLRGAFEVVGDPVVLEGRRSYLSSTAVGEASPAALASPGK